MNNNWYGSVFRKLHLDYHQPPWMPGVAAQVTPELARQQAGMFRESGVEAVEFFAHDHHGYCFFPADPPGRPHPGLGMDYVGNMTSALKAEGLRTIAYLNVYTNVWLKYLLNSLGRRRSQTAYELAPRGSVTPVGPHLLRRHCLKLRRPLRAWSPAAEAASQFEPGISNP